MKKKIFRLLPLAILPMLLSGCEPAHQHEYDYELTTEPTCVTKGIETGTCECGEEITREVDALGHLKEVIDGTPATCTEEGLTDGEKCSRCDEVLVEQETIAKTSHNLVKIEGKPATCTEDGLSDGQKCSVCNQIIVRQETIPAGHKVVTLPKVEPTCHSTGLTEGKKCSVCEKILVEQELIDKLEHVEQIIQGKEPTCTEAGFSQKTVCSLCGDILINSNPIDPLGHKEVLIPGKPATITEDGLTDGKKCSVCEEILVEQTTIPAGDYTPSEEEGAVLKPYKFEFEEMENSGNSQKLEHACIGSSFEFSKDFSGNIGMCNNDKTFTLRFTSNKNVRSPFKIKLVNGGETKPTLGDVITIKNNGYDVIDLTKEFDNSYVPEGCDETYFKFSEVESLISIFEGENVITFTNCSNVDSFELNTSADITYVAPTNHWTTNIVESTVIKTIPTFTTKGRIYFKCSEEGCEKVRERDLPTLDSDVYDIEYTLGKTIYSLKILNTSIIVAELAASHTLTLQDCTFNNGTTSLKWPENEVVSGINVDVPTGYRLDGFVNVDNEAEVYELPFVMPNKDVTIKPLFVTSTKYLLTINDGQVIGGTSSSEIDEGATVNLEYTGTLPEGKKLIGWFDVNDKTAFYNNEIVMPSNALTLSPLFDSTKITYDDKTYPGKITADGKLYLSKEVGCHSLINDKSVSAVKSSTGIHELGGHYNFAGGTEEAPLKNIEVGSHFLTQQMNGWGGKVDKLSTPHKVITTIENYSDEDLTVRVALITSSSNPNSHYGEAKVTIKAKESATVEFTVTKFHGSFMSNIMVKDHTVKEIDIGLFQYIEEVTE